MSDANLEKDKIRPVLASGFVIFRRVADGGIEFLLLQASYGTHHWSPPKGLVEPHESESEAAFRELHEETGIERTQFTIMDNFRKELNYKVNGVSKQVVYWLAHLHEQDVRIKISPEHQAFRWAAVDEACQLAQFDDMKEMLTNADQVLRKT